MSADPQNISSVFCTDFEAAELQERSETISLHQEQDLTARVVRVDGTTKIIVTAGSSASIVLPADFLARMCQ